MAAMRATREDLIRSHIPYEFKMLVGTFGRLNAPAHADNVLNNALIESFCLHARALVDFFKNEQSVHAKALLDACGP